jgi:hypothetical protein
MVDKQLITALVSAVVGGILSAVIAWFTFRGQRERREIVYYYESMPLLKFRPTSEHKLTVTVDKSVLTGDDQGRGKAERVNNAYGFSISLQNAGNRSINAPVILITLDSTAKILEYYSKPETSPDYSISLERDKEKPNVLRVVPPYINVGQSVFLSIVSADNSDSDYCHMEGIREG